MAEDDFSSGVMAEECLTYNNMDIKLPCRLEDLPTPCLLVDEEAVAKNCRDMLAKAAAAGVSLRPHVKTHKCHQIARMQVGGDKNNGIMASTLPEVRHMAADGFVDITYGVPVTTSKVKALLKICVDFPSTRISIFIDSEEQLREVESVIDTELGSPFASSADTQAYVQKHRGKVFGCFLKIDVGYHRAGVDVQQDPDTAVSLAQKLNASKLLDFRGVYSHSGNAYNASSAAEAKAISDLECSRAASFAKGLQAAHVPCPTISVGSTPSCAAADQFVGANEIHPGNYVFFDRQQMAIPVCNSQQVAVRVLTRVIGRYAAHYLCDTGSLAISKDLSPLDASYGQVEGSSLLLTAVSQECGKLQVPDNRPRGTMAAFPQGSTADNVDADNVDDQDGAEDAVAPDALCSKRAQSGEPGGIGDSKRSKHSLPESGTDALPLGTLLKIIPNHSCLTAACHRLYFVVRGDEVVDVWRPCHGW